MLSMWICFEFKSKESSSKEDSYENEHKQTTELFREIRSTGLFFLLYTSFVSYATSNIFHANQNAKQKQIDLSFSTS